MGETYLEQAEQTELFRQKQNDNSGLILHAQKSAGSNPLRLAQILSAFDFAMNLLGWQDKPLANLTVFLTNYQASLDAKYHNDFKEVLIAQEIERRREERKGVSILSQ